jgi:hypothetical protein
MVIFDKLVTERRPTIGSVPPRRGLPPFGRAPCLPWQDSHLFAGEGCSASPLSITRKDRPTPGVRLPCTRGRNYMVNEQLPWLTPLSQQDRPGLFWRIQRRKVESAEEAP